ncbi:MAG TPA: galactokinase [Firmicutes bacterium]|nr:galactokinase [Bacillota bacterium]
MNIQTLKLLFTEVFGEKEIHSFFSPGRVNLIGEHIDYNGGCVFPCAITYGTYAIVSYREDSKVRLYSGNFEEVGMLEFDLTDLAHTENENFSAFVKGVIVEFNKLGHNIEKGFDAYILGTIPNGSGLSSSASLELLISQILKTQHNIDIDMVEMVKLSQRAENQYVGVNCGIMDQFAIGMGKKDYAIKLNTNDLSYEYAEADLQDAAILIMNTNKKRELADSKYNERRGECDQALALLQTKANMNFLCDLTEAQFNDVSDVLENEVLYKRAKHAVTENERVVKAIDALAAKDLVKFGELLNQSHISLRDDYEVTGLELDTIVELAWAQEGVLGARMTGAGFGGCAIALVKQENLEAAREAIAAGYKKAIGYEADFYVATIGDGTKTL